MQRDAKHVRREEYFSERHRVLFGQFTVDSFRYRTRDYPYHLLSHFHSDHYGGLSKTWKHGLIVGTAQTLALVRHKFFVGDQYLFPVALNTPVPLRGSDGNEYVLTLVDAGHCPGSCCFVLTSKAHSKTVLHTGDMRYDAALRADEGWRCYVHNIDTVFLDTTYADPMYAFPERRVVCEEAARIVEHAGPKTLVLVGTYSIGKEVFAESIATHCGLKIGVDGPKHRLLELAGRDMSLYTMAESRLQLQMLGANASLDNLACLLSAYKGRYAHIISFVPTGWARKTERRGNVEVSEYKMPYSEHSAFPELVTLLRDVHPTHIVPTVFDSPAHARQIEAKLRAALAPKPGTLFAFGARVSERPSIAPRPSTAVPTSPSTLATSLSPRSSTASSIPPRSSPAPSSTTSSVTPTPQRPTTSSTPQTLCSAPSEPSCVFIDVDSDDEDAVVVID